MKYAMLEWAKHNLSGTMDRDFYLALEYPEGLPEDWGAENEAELPPEFRLPNPTTIKLRPGLSNKERAIIWHNAISHHLDASEPEMRDVIERGYMTTAGRKRVKVADVMRVHKRVMAKINAIRLRAIKAAFRHIRDKDRDL